MDSKKVWFITGTSKGFGWHIVNQVLNNGGLVAATVRSDPDKLRLSFNDNPRLLILTADVTDEDSVKFAVKQTIEKWGRIDVLVNNAGYGLITAIEEASNDEVKKQYDTNVFGVLNVIRAVLPFMRERRAGHIINISSMGGYDAFPGWGIYCSTKFAVEGISKALAAELLPLKIKVTSVAPGVFRTGFLNTGAYAVAKNSIADYEHTAGNSRKFAIAWNGTQPGDPRKLAQIVADLPDMEPPPLHLPLGPDAVEVFKTNMERTSGEIKNWLIVSNSTDF